MSANLKVVVDDQTLVRLKQIAAATERDVSKVVRLAIREYLQREGEKNGR